MTTNDERAVRAEALLGRHGIAGARVVPLGAYGEIAAIRAPAADPADLARLAPEIRALGFRYVALDPPANDEVTP
ncbi:MAG TPA: hypothetical protein VNZ57_01135 [Longimicrobiales bacterium]|nr:hypothetical protein [Longimicrobiales bacterium]